MASAAHDHGGPSALHALTQQGRKEVNQALVKQSFDRILDILQQLNLHKRSPKLFIIYAHDNQELGFKAYQDIVKKYISWFKKIRFNVDSDKSPHGYGYAHGVGHPGASNDIFLNQVCLLPKKWHKQNVDYVLVFYSKILARYMKGERDFKHENRTYSDAMIDTCQQLDDLQDQSQQKWDAASDKIRAVQQTYSEAMKGSFHHVLTETALLSFTNKVGGIDKTIPIMLFGDEDWEDDLKWQPHFVHNKDTQIRIRIKPEDKPEQEYLQFFKILLEFETLEKDRPLIDVMIRCFEDSVKLLEEDLQPEMYRTRLEVLIVEALRSLSYQWQTIKRPITRADIRSRLDLYSKLDCESIRRISGDRVLGNLHDIDLAVTEHFGSRGEGQGKRSGKGSVERQQREREIVPLHGLFDERNVGKETIRPQRILIQGRPGIGKTTLCRRLMYEYSWHASLRAKFHLVVRIPVGKLEYSANLNNLLFEEYFYAVAQGHDLANKLGGLILDYENANLGSNSANSMNILIILDGLDEARRWSQERRGLLKRLMERPAVIITSRSYDTHMLHRSDDLLVEALGLSMMSVDAYLDNDEIVPSDSATEIHQFIGSKPFIMDMVRVPIHLDILCYSWDELLRQNAPMKIRNKTDEGENVSPTITSLYQAVVRSLWRKDIPELGKVDYGEPVTARVINAVRNTARLERLVDIESTFLEEIANLMMVSDRLEFTDEDIAEAIQRTESKDRQLPLNLEKNLLELSFLRSYPSERHRKFRFVHLTFQEFFAARYLARHVAHSRASFETILRQHKYNRRYEVVWMFVTGLLSQVEELDFFFDLLDDEPRDLVGIQHIQLFTHCLSECQIQIRPSRWNEYQTRLENWLELEISKRKRYGIGSDMACPENILPMNLLTSEYPLNLMETIRDRPSLSESLIKNVNRLITKEHNMHLLSFLLPTPLSCELMIDMRREFPTIGIPKQKPRLSETYASFFIEQIVLRTKHKDAAFAILRRQRHLPDVTVRELVERLKEPPLSEYADQILGNQINLPKDRIDDAVEKLTSRSGYLCEWSENSVLLRQDLHAEAIGKVLDFLENKFRVIPDHVLLDVSRMHLLQSNDIERLGKLIKKNLDIDYGYKGLLALAVEALGQSVSPATNFLKILVKLSRHAHRKLIRAAQNVLQKQPALQDDIIDKLRDLFRSDKDKVVAILKERLQLPDRAIDWLRTYIPERKDEPIKYEEAVNYLLSDTDLPDYLVNHLPGLILEGIDSSLIATLICQQKILSNEVVDRLVKLIPFEHYTWSLGERPVVINRYDFVDPLITALEQARSITQAMDTASLLKHTNLDQESLQRLRSLLTSNPLDDLAATKSELAIDCLCQQVKLDPRTISILHDVIREGGFRQAVYYSKSLWRSRHIEQFCANLALCDCSIIIQILRVFLDRSVEDLAPAYINGETLYFYAADGKLTEQKLEDEKALREKFREAQKRVKLPEWAWMKLPKAREEQDPRPASES